MAAVNMAVANPTNVDVTTNGKTAKARALTTLAFDDAALIGGWNDAVYFLANGCAIASEVGSTFQQRENEGFLLENLERTI